VLWSEIYFARYLMGPQLRSEAGALRMQQNSGFGLRVLTWDTDILKQSMYGIGAFRDTHDKISAEVEVFSRK